MIASLAQGSQFCYLPFADLWVNTQECWVFLVLLNKTIHADHNCLLAVQFLLIFIGRLFYLGLHETAFNGSDTATEGINLLNIVPGLFFNSIRQRFAVI